MVFYLNKQKRYYCGSFGKPLQKTKKMLYMIETLEEISENVVPVAPRS